MYKKEFQITENVSNNSFSYDKRTNPTITVPDIVDGSIDDVKIGDKIVFEDFDEDGNLKSCTGLQNFIRTVHPTTKKPVIIVDNHNHVFYFWYEARTNGQINNGATLIHIDQHKDIRKPAEKLNNSDDLNSVFKYTNSILNVGNYIPPAMEEGLVRKVIPITSESEINKNTPEGAPVPPDKGVRGFARLRGTESSLIVNIDLDFWAPEMDYIDNKLKIDTTKKWMEKADLITIATSPFFIDQELALKVLKELLYN
ncbi:UPF0489 family protein [Patescibacteria group bacterium]|nr:UPF0489 family protein [Patescibacteria group bacterium]MBU1683385.1 UPF0489 family protein [Patescibacteria group bacterium]MBU1935470.1 UPF0489 family protein [Patescibacteria group bacterium]